MMKVVLMCAPSGQCQVLHDEGSLNVCSIRTPSCQVLHDEGSLNVCSIRTMSGIT